MIIMTMVEIKRSNKNKKKKKKNQRELSYWVEEDEQDLLDGTEMLNENNDSLRKREVLVCLSVCVFVVSVCLSVYMSILFPFTASTNLPARCMDVYISIHGHYYPFICCVLVASQILVTSK